MTEVTVATKIGSEELKRIDAIVRRRGLLNRSDFVKEAIWLYLSLSSLETEARLRMLRLINESVGVSGKSARQLIEKARKQEDIYGGALNAKHSPVRDAEPRRLL